MNTCESVNHGESDLLSLTGITIASCSVEPEPVTEGPVADEEQSITTVRV